MEVLISKLKVNPEFDIEICETIIYFPKSEKQET